ncbi:hypothetical protein M3Y99_01094100 [Aphelenchoides fujianensis]|nr:hypothetical protein M3Y99_01094100 [Aphelenchoides fujianensis]
MNDGGDSSGAAASLLEAVKSAAKSALFRDLDEHEGQKVIIWETTCMKHVDLLIPYPEFTSHNVKHHFVLSEKPAEDLPKYPLEGVRHLFFVIPPQKRAVQRVLECLAVKLPNRPTPHVRVLTRIPKHLEEFFAEDPRVRQRPTSLEAWPFFWLPAFGDLVLNNFAPAQPARLLIADDFELFFSCAAALNETLAARRVCWRGEWAQQVVQNLRTLKAPSTTPSCIFDQLIVVDRTLDPVSPLLEQFFFAGLLDAMFGISVKGAVEVHEGVLKQELPLHEAAEGKLEKIPLNAEIYARIVHSSIGDAVGVVRKVLRELADIESAHGQLSSINDFKQYMPALQKLVKSKAAASQAFRLCSIAFCFCAQPENRRRMECERQILAGHFNASTPIEHVEEAIIAGGTEADGLQLLRLVVLQSLVNGGLSAKLWNEYQKLLVQSFGPPAAIWCLNLQISGLIQLQGSSATRFAHVAADLKRLKTRSATTKRALFVVGGLTRAEIACLHAQPNGFAAIFTTSILKPKDMLDFTTTTA